MIGAFADATARSECRTTLERLLSEEMQALRHLEGLLGSERDVLVRNESPEELEAVCARRQECMGSLLRIQDERRGVLRMLGVDPDNAGLERIVRECDPQRTLPARWAECSELARRCRELNDFNGALVSSRMRRVEGLLEAITGRRPQQPVYGRQGQQSWVNAGRLLAAEA